MSGKKGLNVSQRKKRLYEYQGKWDWNECEMEKGLYECHEKQD